MRPVLFGAVLQDGALCLRLGERIVPLWLGGAPVESFVPGWRPVFLYTGFSPFALLQFSSDSGEAAIWIVDADGTRLGGSVEELEPGARETLRAAATLRVAHLMDAVPVTLGQEFGGYAAQIRLGAKRVRNALPQVAQIPLGGTATGTGLNTHADFRDQIYEVLRPS